MKPAFFHPRYWLTWLGLAVSWLLAQLPYGMQLLIGRLVGRLMYQFSRHRKHIANINLSLCFPDMEEPEKKDLIRRHFVALGIAMMETGLSWWASAPRLRRLGQVEGIEFVAQALQRGKGVIMLSGHLTTLEIGGTLFGLNQKMSVTYRPHKNPVFEFVMAKARSRHFEDVIPHTDSRAVIKALKENKIVWYAPDQNYYGKNSVFVPFFNVPASTMTATARLATISHAAVVPLFFERLTKMPDSGKAGYRITVKPALNNFPSDNIQQDTTAINKIIEQNVELVPEQYLWVHMRFKTRPPGEDPVY